MGGLSISRITRKRSGRRRHYVEQCDGKRGCYSEDD